MSKPPCLGCAFILRALPQLELRWSLLSALRASYLARTPGVDPSEVVFVVGEPSLLPASLRGRGVCTVLAMHRRDLLHRERYPGPVGELFAQLNAPAAPGHAWVIAAMAADPTCGAHAAIAAFQHAVPEEPSERAAELLALGLVPEDGGAAPGARINAPGGKA